MRQHWQQMLAAFIMGLLLPGLILRLSLHMAAPLPLLQKESVGATQQTDTPQSIPLPVVTGEGVVVSMELEQYLVGVLLAEMPASFEAEALKAQAVVARTYALRRVKEADRHRDGAVCTDPGCCQAYISPEAYREAGGSVADILKITRAVEATTGQVLTYEGYLAEATYFSCSGGRTEDAAAVWGTAIPYLQSVDSPGEEQALPYSQTVSFTPADFARALGRELAGQPKDWLGIVTYTQGGGVATMVIAGVSYTGVRLRQMLQLNSTAFTVSVSGDDILISTLGKGHRVGMSQYGAEAMAVTGSNCEEILQHYYPGTKIDKINAIE